MIKYNILFILFCILALCSCRKKDLVKPVKTVVAPGDYHQNGDVSRLYFNGDNNVNIVIMGDGFIKDDLVKGGNYDTQVKNLIDYLFTVAPFRQNKQYFNTWVVYAESKTRGATKGLNVQNTNTKFNSFFDIQIDRLLEVGNADSVYKYAALAVPITKANLLIVLVNDNTYGGSGGAIAVVSTNELSRYIMIHEIGHTFGGLGDEYVDASVADDYSTDMVQYLPNIDTTNDPKKIKWAHFLDKSAYKNIVGAYEGAYYRPIGFFRPEQRSIMTDLNTLNYNAPSREAIVRRMDEILNIPFDFNAFLLADSSSILPIFGFSNNNKVILPPKNDFIGLRDRIIQLQKNKKQ